MKVEILEKFWFDKTRYDKAETQYYEDLNRVPGLSNECPLVSEIARAREHIQSSLEKMDGIPLETSSTSEILKRLTSIELDNRELKSLIVNLNYLLNGALQRIAKLEDSN